MKNDKINRMVKQLYDENTQYLNLDYQINNWFEILLHRDWSMIKKLTLNKCCLDDHRIMQLFKLQWPQLTWLELRHNYLTIQTVKNFAQKDWGKLQSFFFSNNIIADQGLQILLQNLIKNKLIFLGLHRCGLSWKGMKNLINSHNTHHIKELYLGNNIIGNKGIKLLTKSDLPNLQKLFIEICGIECQGFKHLSKSHHPNLNQIKIGFGQYSNDNKIQLDGAQKLNEKDWKNIEQISLPQNNSICCINYVLLDLKNRRINLYRFQIENYEMENCIGKILSSKFDL